MSEKKKLNETGAAEVIWDLSDLYPAADAPELKRDQKRLRELASRFQESYRGKVKGLTPSGLAQALTDYEEIIQVSGKIGSFGHLIWSTNTESPAYGKLLQQASELDRKSTRLNSSHVAISYAVFCLKKNILPNYRYDKD